MPVEFSSLYNICSPFIHLSMFPPKDITRRRLQSPPLSPHFESVLQHYGFTLKHTHIWRDGGSTSRSRTRKRPEILCGISKLIEFTVNQLKDQISPLRSFRGGLAFVHQYSRCFPIYTLTNSFSAMRTTRTGHGACRTTFSAVLPKSACSIPECPCVAMMIRSIDSSLA